MVVEDYVVFRLTRLTDGSGQTKRTDVLTDEHLVPLLLRERRTLSADARRELLPHRFSYYSDDLTILTRDNALVVEPKGDDRDVEYILEFANAQLLELRYYDGAARRMALMRRTTPGNVQARQGKDRWALYRGRSDLLDSYEHADGMMVVMQWFRHPGERKKCLMPGMLVDSQKWKNPVGRPSQAVSSAGRTAGRVPHEALVLRYKPVTDQNKCHEDHQHDHATGAGIPQRISVPGLLIDVSRQHFRGVNRTAPG